MLVFFKLAFVQWLGGGGHQISLKSQNPEYIIMGSKFQILSCSSVDGGGGGVAFTAKFNRAEVCLR